MVIFRPFILYEAKKQMVPVFGMHAAEKNVGALEKIFVKNFVCNDDFVNYLLTKNYLWVF